MKEVGHFVFGKGLFASIKGYLVQQRGTFSLQKSTQTVQRGRWRWNPLNQKLFLKSLFKVRNYFLSKMALLMKYPIPGCFNFLQKALQFKYAMNIGVAQIRGALL